jgi:hypothetical protein
MAGQAPTARLERPRITQTLPPLQTKPHQTRQTHPNPSTPRTPIPTILTHPRHQHIPSPAPRTHLVIVTGRAGGGAGLARVELAQPETGVTGGALPGVGACAGGAAWVAGEGLGGEQEEQEEEELEGHCLLFW